MFFVIVAVLGVLWFIGKGGGPVLNPFYADWLRSGDWAWHQLGWLFFHRDGWHLPLGTIRHFPEPSGTSIGYVDGIPWLALLMKLFPQRSPDDFQYLGPWLGVCFAGQAVTGAMLCALATPRRLLQGIGAMFYVVAPILLFRIGHVALCSQWLILLALWLYLAPCPDAQAGAYRRRGGAVLLGIAAGIHPYLMLMVFCLLLALLVRLWRGDLLSGKQLGRWSLGYLGVVAVVFGLLGFFDLTTPTSDGYGIYSADFLTLLNPLDRSVLLPALPIRPGQYEGFGYLGLGVLALLLGLGLFRYAALRESLRRGQWLIPLIAACLALAIYALSLNITVAGHLLVSSKFTFFRLAEIFQSSGRFVWPLHYLLVTAAVLGTLRFFSPRGALAILLIALALQVYEQKKVHLGFAATPPVSQLSPGWQLATGHYRKLVVYPPALGCCHQAQYPAKFPIPLGYLAYKLQMTVNSAALSRGGGVREERYCAALEQKVKDQQLAPEDLYIVHPDHLAELSGLAICATVDSYNVCVRAANRDAFADFLAQQPKRPPAPLPQ